MVDKKPQNNKTLLLSLKIGRLMNDGILELFCLISWKSNKTRASRDLSVILYCDIWAQSCQLLQLQLPPVEVNQSKEVH